MSTIFNFPSTTFFVLLIGLLLLFSAIVSFEIFEKNKLSLWLIFLAGLFICSFMAMLDPFLNSWDEQFHALVAKNILLHPLMPTLIEKPIVPYDFVNWTCNHVWLHKQPLFLWQIALSLKLFGINEFAVRIPSIIMMSIVPLFIYRIGKLSLNARAGFYGAVLFCSNYFMHEFVSGFPASDHNDLAFVFYITASLWAWIEYESSGNRYWLLLIAFFSGCAVLVKWLVGLLVYLGWGLSILFDKEKRTSFVFYKNIILCFIFCLLIFVPWQLYILSHFPNESHYEYALNTKHFFNVVELHGGDAWYYFKNLETLYGAGDFVPYLVIIALLVLFRKLNNHAFKIGIFANIIFVYLFFTLAATKMVGFCYIVSPLIFLALACVIESIFALIKFKLIKNQFIHYPLILIITLFLVLGNLDLHQIAHKHTMFINPNDNDKRIEKINDAQFIKSLKEKIGSDDYVIFNCKPERDISIMFYTNFTAYRTSLTFENYRLLKQKNIKLAVIDNGKLLDFIKNDVAIIKIKAPDKSWEN